MHGMHGEAADGGGTGGGATGRGGPRTTDLTVGGMTCAACVQRVEKKPAGWTGSRRASPGHRAGPGSHPPHIGPGELVAVVERAGYTGRLCPNRPGGGARTARTDLRRAGRKASGC
ncbi:hypothetical protein LT493_10210 [Streptomyces tricolor]|nr:hypothetical protein [Streptomyces tricolor]